MRSILIIALLLASFSFGQSYKRVESPKALKSELATYMQSTNSLKADFTETSYSSMFNTPKKATGILRFVNPAKIRWEHKDPKSHIVLINGKSVKIQEDGQEVSSAGANRIAKKIQSLMVNLMSGDFLEGKEFNITYYESDKYYKLALKPKSSRMAKYISAIHLVFNRDDMSILKMSLLESDTDKVVYRFSNTERNKSIPSSTFTQF